MVLHRGVLRVQHARVLAMKHRDDKDLDRMREKLYRLAQKRPRRKPADETPDTSLRRLESKRDRKNSKAKGSQYENKIAKRFAKWSGNEIRRTPGSGGWSKAAFGVTGDLVCTSKKYPFHHECKKREGWNLDDLIVGTRKRDTRSILAWWKQCVDECPRGKIPTLIFAKNRMSDLILMKRTDYGSLFKIGDFSSDLIPHFTFNLDSGEVIIMALEDFFLRVRPPKGCKNRKSWQPGTVSDLVRVASEKYDNQSSSEK